MYGAFLNFIAQIPYGREIACSDNAKTQTIDIDNDGDLDLIRRCSSLFVNDDHEFYKDEIYVIYNGMNNQVDWSVEPLSFDLELPLMIDDNFVLSDLDDDGDVDIIFLYDELLNIGYQTKVGAYENKLSENLGFQFHEDLTGSGGEQTYYSLSVANLDNTYGKELLIGQNLSNTDSLLIYSVLGNYNTERKASMWNGTTSAHYYPLLYDAEQDGLSEFVLGDNLYRLDGDEILYVMSMNGLDMEVGEVGIVLDIDNDGDLDVIGNRNIDDGDPEKEVFLLEHRQNLTLTPIIVNVVQPSFVNVGFMIEDDDLLDYLNLDNLRYYDIKENGDAISEAESVPDIGKFSDIPAVQRTVLMLDNSFSIGLDLSTVKEAAKTFVRGKFDKQQISVWTFSENVIQRQAFTADTSALIQAISSIQIGPPSTNLYGAVLAGTQLLETAIGPDGILLSTLIIMTDGEDTQGSVSEEDAIAAVQGHEVFTVGVGDQCDWEVLGALGVSGYSGTDFDNLANDFLEIQRDIEIYSNSLYWLSYISPSRNNPNNTLEIALRDNTVDSTIEVQFSSVGFSSVLPGVYVNRDFNRPLGVDTLLVDCSEEIVLDAETLFGLYSPDYSWSLAQPGLMEIVQVGGEGNKQVELRCLGASHFTTSITLVDNGNGFQREVVLVCDATGVEDRENAGRPQGWRIAGVSPNPFNPTCMLELENTGRNAFTIQVYNILGQLVKEMSLEAAPSSGTRQILVDLQSQASGLYIVSASDGMGHQQCRKVMLLK